MQGPKLIPELTHIFKECSGVFEPKPSPFPKNNQVFLWSEAKQINCQLNRPENQHLSSSNKRN